ncbi:MAG: hypothetical protein CO162_06420 [bacterium (Candidatus Ratteibacteria) CG_4_9_14_3_um_filter_41_21]|uniref:L-fucose isomerase C-terminal domain-containing protein n=3 Tax=Candidatus Ratteibacteria TaxID=2979319 RepID=A0A2M7YEN9_9BACT|nr:MAG: hypothetical protein CO162_06420 [bacterium (Candidatus Ratteibacteria) CG_4_9_14_3_um_filter_41_21]
MSNLKGMKRNRPQNRLCGDLPKIGIRPTIDGRRKGVREFLEKQTMNMAKSAAKFLTENLKYANGMPVTMSRINIIKGLGPVLQIAEGETVDLPKGVHRILNERTDPTWPTTWFVPRLTGKGPFKDVYSVMNNWGANHGAVSYGHIGADLITLASILRIPVCMHNVPEERIFRPSAWNGFGMDPEGADFRACSNFGPLYGV